MATLKNKSAIDMHNTIHSDEAAAIIETNARTLMENPDLCNAIPPIMLRGAPGVGKSSVVKAVADKLGIGFIDIRLSQMEPVDLRGLPVPNKDTKTVEWYVTSDLPNEERDGKNGILLFDELTSADRSLQVASYELILDRRLGKLYNIPKGWYIVACGNRVEDRAVATSMSSALANRLMHFDVEADSEDWCKWASKSEIHPSVLGFIRYRPACLFEMEGQNLERGWPSPRSWERVSSMIPMFNNNEACLRKIVYGLIGNRVGVEFMEFHKINKNFDDVLKMMTNPKVPVTIPEKNDQKYAFVSAVQYLLWRGKDEADEKARIDGFYRICEKLTSDFATMLMMGCMAGTKTITQTTAAKKLFANPGYKAWAKAHGAALRKRISL